LQPARLQSWSRPREGRPGRRSMLTSPATTAVRPWRMTTGPSPPRTARACFMVATGTFCSSLISRTEGSGSPAVSIQERIAFPAASATCCQAGHGGVRLGLASRRGLLEQLAELDLRRPFGLAGLPQPDLPARQRVGPGIDLHAPGSARESLYVSGSFAGHDIPVRRTTDIGPRDQDQ